MTIVMVFALGLLVGLFFGTEVARRSYRETSKLLGKVNQALDDQNKRLMDQISDRLRARGE